MVYRKRHAGSGTGCWAFQWMTGCAPGSSSSAQRTARWHHHAANCSLVIFGSRPRSQALSTAAVCRTLKVARRQIGKQGFPAGRQNKSHNCSRDDRRRIWLAAAALICCPELTDRSEPQRCQSCLSCRSGPQILVSSAERRSALHGGASILWSPRPMSLRTSPTSRRREVWPHE